MGDDDGELSIDEFHALFSWPEELADKGEAQTWLWCVDLDAKREKLWPLVADTSRINRHLGLAKMVLEERGGLLYGEATHGGVRHTWVEPPWDWEAARVLSVVRKYDQGYFHYVRSIYYLVPHGEGTRLYVYFGWVAKGLFGRLALRLGMPSLETQYRRVLESLAAEARKPNPTPFHVAAEGLGPSVLARLSSLTAALGERGVGDEVIGRLGELVRAGDEMELDRIQPRRLAREWDLPPRDVLVAFLQATRLGLFDLSWDVVCPLCRGAKEQVGELSDLPAEGACDICNLEFGLVEDHVVEVSFRIHPSIRQVDRVFYCSAEAASKLHIKVQTRVEAGAEKTVHPAFHAGQYRVRSLEDGTHQRALTVTSDGAPSLEVGRGGELAPCAPGAPLLLRNDGDAPSTFVVEHLSWEPDILQPGHLFGLQDFRDIFDAEYIAAGVQLAVGKQTLMFTDIVGSTKFYAERGDPGAFVVVRDHFKVLYEIVRSNDGAVIKTIGDAVMAAFPTGLDALVASKAVHEAFDGKDSPVRLRISLNSGPCIAVNWNHGIDYFGGTVNLAAKLQACCETSEIAMSGEVYEGPGVGEYLEAEGAKLEELTFEVKALGQTVPVYRWTI